MGGGAWPFLVGGVICLVNSVTIVAPMLTIGVIFLEGLLVTNQRKLGAITGL